MECNLQHKRGLLEQDEFKLSNDKKKIKQWEEYLNNARENYKKTFKEEYQDNQSSEIEKEVFDDATVICPTCGQRLPEDKIDQLKAEFEENKKIDF